jgi:outer membrane protein OmpA-like peptidoglycan-associated protein
MLKKLLFFPLVLLLSLLNPVSVNAQKPLEKRANRLYENFAFAEAAELYAHIIKKSPQNKQAVYRLAICLMNNGNTRDAEKTFKNAIELGVNDPDTYIKQGVCQIMNAKREEARATFEKTQQLYPSDMRSAFYLESLNNTDLIYAESEAYRVERLPLSSIGSDFSPLVIPEGGKSKMLLVSNGLSSKHAKSKDLWNKKRWFDLWEVEMANDSTPMISVLLNGKINTKFHEGPASWNATTNEIAFTRNAFYKGRVTRSKDRVNKLNIFFSRKNEQGKPEIIPFEHNNSEYSVGHPAFSLDGKTLVFVSDMPGGFGGTDLYVCTLSGSTWSKPQNLGPQINSAGNEMFPFLGEDGTLFFSSNGWGGLGGLDIYKSVREDGAWVGLENAGSPLNSHSDDFGVYVFPNGRRGFFSSNRNSEDFSDHVYRFTYSPIPASITVRDRDELSPVINAEVEILLGEKSKAKIKTDASGTAEIWLNPCKTYTFRTRAEGYPEHEKQQETACKPKDSRDYQVSIRKPKAYVKVYDMYNQKNIEGAKVRLINLSNPTGAPIEILSDTGGFVRFNLMPCQEYEISAERKDLPLVSKKIKAPCSLSEPDVAVRLGTGIAPPKGVILRINIVDEQNGAPVPNARVNVWIAGEKTARALIADAFGEIETITKEGAGVSLETNCVGYFSTSKSKEKFNVPKGDKSVLKTLKLLRLSEGGIIALEGIYYDLNKTNIRKDAAKVLDYVVQVMTENPQMIIELGSHTDSRDTDERNMKLSDGRAAAAAEYIISKGIDATRISGKGYGETQLKNGCGNGIKCTEVQHQENRRTEIKIVSFD